MRNGVVTVVVFLGNEILCKFCIKIRYTPHSTQGTSATKKDNLFISY